MPFQAHASLNGGHIFNAAVLVDPARDEVVACAGDGRRASFGSGAPPSACSHHPLKHATMQAIKPDKDVAFKELKRHSSILIAW